MIAVIKHASHEGQGTVEAVIKRAGHEIAVVDGPLATERSVGSGIRLNRRSVQCGF